MECPRCGGALTRYRLGERETVGCRACEYVGVSVDHTAKHGRPESWDDAIDRFQAQGQSVSTVTRDDLPADVPVAEADAGSLVNGVEVESLDGEDWVVPVFDEADADAEETAATRE
jgi:hypothetical protein